MDREAHRDWTDLEQAIGYVFNNPELLMNAFTHRSFTNENPSWPGPDNERFEFLGDAVLQLCISDLLMTRFPDYKEGQLSKLRAAVVNEQSLANLARRFGMGRFLLLGRGEESSGGREKSSLLADAFEALIAAVYIDGGYREASRLLDGLFAEMVQGGKEEGRLFQDYKSALQELSQRRFHETPRYQLQEECGPDHDKTFSVELTVARAIKTLGTGKNRKEAEQQAAKKAWECLAAVATET